jgi:uroporphyrinogen-III synthase
VSHTKNTLLKNSRVFSVGLETKKKLNEAGFINVFSANNNSKSLYDLVLNSTNEEDYGLWVAAKDRKVDLQNMFKLNDRYIEILESYKTDPVLTLSEPIISFLEHYNQLDLIVFSSRNVSIATDLLKNYKLFEKVNKKSTLFVNSKNIALTAKEIGWSRIEVIKKNFTNDILNHIINLSKHIGN